MPNISLRGYFKPQMLANASVSIANAFNFSSMRIDSIELGVTQNGDAFHATIPLEISNKTYDALTNNGYISDHEELIEGIKSLMEVVQRTVRYVKYFYGIPELDDINEQFAIDTEYLWKDSDENWYIARERKTPVWMPSEPYYKLDDNFLKWVPNLIAKGIEPLFGLTHLHKAFVETNTRHQWIDATIAAELGIKEFFGLYKPDISPMLQHLPSPPISKLYGELLQIYTGIKSPMVSFLSKGAEQRNLLIHRPRQISPNKDETDLYLHRVQVALMHLHTILHPANELFEYLLRRVEDKLSILQERIKSGT